MGQWSRTAHKHRAKVEKLSPVAYQLALRIINAGDGATLHMEELTRDLRASKSKVRSAMMELQEAGIISIEQEG